MDGTDGTSPHSASRQPLLRTLPLIPTRCSPVSHRALAVSSCMPIAVDSSSQLRSPPGWLVGESTAISPCTSAKTAASTRREHMRPGAEETAGTVPACLSCPAAYELQHQDQSRAGSGVYHDPAHSPEFPY